MCQFGEVVVDSIGVEFLDRRSDALVELLAAIDQHRVVGDLLSKSVLEAVLEVAHRGLFVDEFGELQVAQHPVELVIRLSVGRTDQT